MDEHLQANRQLWDQWTIEHERSPFYDVAGFKSGKDRLRSIELSELGDVSGKSLLHLQCHFGMDTLAWARRGARVTGVDLSEKIHCLSSLSQSGAKPSCGIHLLRHLPTPGCASGRIRHCLHFIWCLALAPKFTTLGQPHCAFPETEWHFLYC